MYAFFHYIRQNINQMISPYRLNIKSIINMQLPGEHAHCGPPLDLSSGFTYSPQVFMDNESERNCILYVPMVQYVDSIYGLDCYYNTLYATSEFQ